eukprot:9384224-Pyramimonas_sp.AAC.1
MSQSLRMSTFAQVQLVTASVLTLLSGGGGVDELLQCCVRPYCLLEILQDLQALDCGCRAGKP